MDRATAGAAFSPSVGRDLAAVATTAEGAAAAPAESGTQQKMTDAQEEFIQIGAKISAEAREICQWAAIVGSVGPHRRLEATANIIRASGSILQCGAVLQMRTTKNVIVIPESHFIRSEATPGNRYSTSAEAVIAMAERRTDGDPSSGEGDSEETCTGYQADDEATITVDKQPEAAGAVCGERGEGGTTTDESDATATALSSSSQ